MLSGEASMTPEGVRRKDHGLPRLHEDIEAACPPASSLDDAISVHSDGLTALSQNDVPCARIFPGTKRFLFEVVCDAYHLWTPSCDL